MTPPTNFDAVVARLKDLAYEIDAKILRAVIPTSNDEWTTVEVSHASWLSESRDGWDVVIEEHSL